MSWAVEFHDEFVPEFRRLDRQVQDETYAVARMLEQFGPQLGRPRVDTLNGSSHANMKELRFSAAGGEWRLAFAFDPKRRAILLVAGDKSGGSAKAFLPRAHRQGRRALRPAPRPARQRRRIVMTVNLDDMMADLAPARRRKIEDRAAELIAEEMTLRELRKARRLTQVSVARELGISQDGVSRLEQRSDLLLSTLRRTVEAMGGRLSLIARFPDRPPVELSGIAEHETLD